MPTVRYTNVDGEVLSERRGGTRTLYVPDPLSSVVATRGAGGGVTGTASYWPYGEVRQSTLPATPFRYVGTLGYYTDDPAWLLYVRARYYRPFQGSWMTQDPLWPGESAYGYVGGDPVGRVDPTGMAPPVVKPPEVSPAILKQLQQLAAEIARREGIAAARAFLAARLAALGLSATAIAIIIAGLLAGLDLCRYVATGETGPLTGIGAALGKDSYPDPEDDYVSPDRVRNCRDRCIKQWADTGRVWGSLILSQGCKVLLTRPPRSWLSDCSRICHENCRRTGSMRGATDSAYRQKCNLRWAKKWICNE